MSDRQCFSVGDRVQLNCADKPRGTVKGHVCPGLPDVLAIDVAFDDADTLGTKRRLCDLSELEPCDPKGGAS